MSALPDWHDVYGFWFPPGLDAADAETHRRMFGWWFGGGAAPELPRFAPLLAVARAGQLDGWAATAKGRLALILVLDQFPRGLFAGTAEAYASDAAALRLTLEGLENGQYDALDWPWEKTFFFMPLTHAEGPGHRMRADRAVALAEAAAPTAPERLRPLYEFSAGQARGHREVIARFGRFPHRNAVLGRSTTEDERAYLEAGDFVHRRRPPEG